MDYFNKYPLLSSKYLDFKDWSKLINYINKESSNKSWELGVSLRKDYNKTRTTFTWNHLKNSYLEH